MVAPSKGSSRCLLLRRGEFLCLSAGPRGADAGRTSPRVRLRGASRSPGARRTAPRIRLCNRKWRLGSCRKTQVAQGVVQENANPEDCKEMEIGERNAVRPAAGFSATGLMATALQHQSSGLPSLPTDCRSRLKPRPRCRYLAALPQPWESSRSYAARSSRRMKIAKPVGPLRQVKPDG